jgi:hypothetical protein
MKKELKDAIVTIAEYDGKPVQEYKGKILIGEEYSFTIEGVDYGKEIQWNDCAYHTSADALLQVWRKLRDEINETKADNIDYISYWVELMQHIDALIIDGDYPAACIKLAKIIKQLK